MTRHLSMAQQPPPDLMLMLSAMGDEVGSLPEPYRSLSREFFKNNWDRARTELLARTTRMRVTPAPTAYPTVFRFEADLPYKRKVSSEAVVELHPGPIRGTIAYRHDLFVVPFDAPAIAVWLDPEQFVHHPNFSMRFHALCLGDLPPGPFELTDLLQHLYSILSYQNRTPTDPADLDAAKYFACDPTAMVGLEPVEPLY